MKRAAAAAVLLVILAAGLFVFADHRREEAHERLVQAGEEALAAGETFAAIEAFSGAIYLKPQAMIGYLRRGEAYQQRHELEAALRDLLRAVELDPYAPRTYELLGDVNYALLRFGRAAERYQSCVALDDQSPRVLYKLALAQFAAGQPHSSEATLRAAIEFDDRFAEAYYLLGLSLRDLQRLEEAAVALERSVSLTPALLQAREELGILYERLGRPDDRIAQLEALRGLDADPSREVSLALAYARSGRTDYAVAALGQTIERYPDYPYTRIALGRVWLDIAEARQDHVALSKARGALEAVPSSASNSEALTLLGRALLLTGEVERAERVLLQAARKRPADAGAFFHLADAAERLGHIPTALDALLDYHTLVGDPPDARRRVSFAARVASLATRSGDPALAATWYERAIAAGAADLGLLVRYAEARAASGNLTGATTTVQEVLEKDPRHPGALALQRRLR
ncbi:MAG: tetratricopeptide repeat protein [Acidobacteria bacterium]|nr:tetratricopeptide repeat protein [Acidobacteriota bacterium]MBA3884623.1 tetratricopeptide repeat protein [Acidobacteriota bacterium]